jgi:hypothetical protein
MMLDPEYVERRRRIGLGRKTKWDSERLQRVLAARSAGQTYKQIGLEHGVSKSMACIAHYWAVEAAAAGLLA